MSSPEDPFKPYISPDQKPKELTVTAIVGMLVFMLFMLLLSPFFIYRAVTLELNYTANTETRITIETFRSQEEYRAKMAPAEAYVLPVANEPKDKKPDIPAQFNIPCDNRVGYVVLSIPRLASAIKIKQATLIYRGQRYPLSFDKIFWDRNSRHSAKVENGILILKPGNRLNVQIALDDTLKISRSCDVATLLYITLLSLLPALLIAKKTSIELSPKNAYKLLYSAAALILMLSPALLLDYYGVVSNENRFLNKFPSVFIHQRFNFAFPKQMEAWFQDRFYGRETAIKHQRVIFSQDLASQQRIVTGKDGWWYLNVWNSIDMYQNKNRFDDTQLKICAQNVLWLNNYFQKRNIKLYILLTPDKERVYPEYYPPIYKQMHPEPRLTQLYNYLSQNTPVPIICPLPQLLEGKTTAPMYFKKGTHWTYRGAYIGMSLLLQKIKEDFPNMPMEQPNAQRWTKELCADTDVAKEAGYTDPYKQLPKEELIYEKPIIQCKYSYQKIDAGIAGFCFLKEYTPEKAAPGSLRIFAYTDSFFPFGVGFMFPAANHLFHVQYRGFFDLNYVHPHLKAFHPDIVIIESTERFLERFLTLAIDED